MSHSFTKLLCHCVFSTKGRRALLKGSTSDRVNAYMAGIARNHDAHLIRAGGTADHRHLLLELKPTTHVSEVMRFLKANSSRWLGETYPECGGFAWQTGYGAFSVSQSARAGVTAYIDRQQEHHRAMSFEDELRVLLEKHGVPFDPAALSA